MKQFLIFVKIEWFHIWRDRRTLFILICMPIVQIILYGFALTNEVKNSNVAIFDQSRDVSTMQISNEIAASRYFNLVKNVYSYNDIAATFRKGKIRMAIVFPQNFRYDLLHSNHAQIQLIADASDPNTANTLTSYASVIINDYQQSLNQNDDLPYTINTQVRMLYNPELKGAYGFVPGVMALVHYDDFNFNSEGKRNGHHGSFACFAVKTIQHRYCQNSPLSFCFAPEYYLYPFTKCLCA